MSDNSFSRASESTDHTRTQTTDALIHRKPVLMEYWAPVLASLALLITCAMSAAHQPYWVDEVLTYFMLTDRSFGNMIAALSDQINANPPLYFSVGWVWAQVFGGSELSLRLFSSIGLCASFWIMWGLLRKHYGTLVASAACIFVFFTAPEIKTQNSQARFYGLLMLLCALALWKFIQFVQNREPDLKSLAVNALLHAGLVQIHYLAIFYSLSFLLALLAYDLRRKRFRPKVYASIVLGWLTLAPWIPAFRRHADMGKPWGWILPPSLRDLAGAYFLFSSYFFILVMGLICLAVGIWALRRRTQPPHPLPADQGNKHDLNEALGLLGGALILIPPGIVFILSRIMTPMFVTRYFILGAVGWVLLVALLLSFLVGRKSEVGDEPTEPPLASKVGRSALAGLAVLLVIGHIVVQSRHPHHVTAAEQIARLTGSDALPIVCESPHAYFPLEHYGSQPQRFIQVQDWGAALDPMGVRNGPGDYKAMVAMHRHYPVVRIMEGADLLRTYSSFYVLHEKGRRWFAREIESNPHYHVTFLAGNLPGLQTFNLNVDLVRVDRAN